MGILEKNELRELENRRDRLLNELENLSTNIEKLKNRQSNIPNFSILLNEVGRIKNTEDLDSFSFSLRFKEKEYEYVLGGDGRSAPWSEKRFGKMCTITKHIPMDDFQKELIIRAVSSLGEVEHIEFK